MPRRKKATGGGGDIPAWFMTYSDVITLMMTFFILLLTFSTNEPERFEQMQIATFGAGGGTGVAGQSDSPTDRDSLVLRYRPNSARKSLRGAESPPLQTDPVTESLAKGLKSLEQTDELASAERVSVDTSLALMRSQDGAPTAAALQQLRMLAVQIRALPLSIDFQVENEADAEFVVQLGRYLLEAQQIPAGRVSVSIVASSIVPERTLRIVMTRMLRTP